MIPSLSFLCFAKSALSSITIKKSLIIHVNSGKPTFPVPFLEAVFKALFISKIELPCGSNLIFASFANS